MVLPKFKNQKLYQQAFTHRSYLNESSEKISSNERLEFLGDSVLSIIVSNYLYDKYSNFEEGTLTNLRSLLVNTKNLAEIAKELEFGSLLKLSKGEEQSKGRLNQSILANTLEAFIGALYLDQGLEAVEKLLKEILLPKADFFVQNKSFKDPKSLLQEKIQARKKASPLYKVLSESGPAHQKQFTVGVFVNGQLLARGSGKSKRQAEEDAAKKALSS